MSFAITPDAASTKLPLGATIRLAYVSFVTRFADLLRISWVWLGIAALPISTWLGLPHLADFIPTARSANEALARWWIEIGFTAAFLLAAASIAVAWHRLLILNETPPLSGSNVLSGRLWRYVLVGILMTLVIWVPAVLMIALVLMMAVKAAPSLFSSDPVSDVMVRTSLAVILGLALLAGARLSLALPGQATDERPRSLTSAWRFGQGNSWRLLAGLLACLVPWVLGQIVPAILPDLPDTLNDGAVGTIVDGLFAIYVILTLQVPIAFLSHAHRFIAGRA